MLPLFLMSEAMLRRVEANQKADFERMVSGAIAWDEDATKFATRLCLTAESYKPQLLFDVEPVQQTAGQVKPENGVVSPCGRFVYVNRVLPRGTMIGLCKGRERGLVGFTDNVVIPTLTEIIGPGMTQKLWMSVTPHEMISQRPGIRSAKGKVVVGGLGMGWFLHKVAARPQVSEIVLVERSQSLVDWVLPRAIEVWPHIGDKLKDRVVVGDAVEQIGKHEGVGGTRYLLDIWEGYGAAKWDRAFQAAKKKAEFVWGWGDVWIDKER